MVSLLLVEEKGANSEGWDGGGQHELALFSKRKMKKAKGST